METRGTRLFVALKPTDPVRRALAELAGGVAQVQWTPPAQVHLTLRFIGEQPEESVEKVADALGAISVKPFHLPVEGAGAFPERGDPRVLWVGIGKGHPHLHQLRQRVDDQLLAAGIPFELRPFVPHLTLGRTGEASPTAVKQWLKQHRGYEGPVWPVGSFALMASEPVGGRREHRLIREYGLAEAEAKETRFHHA